MSRPFEIKRVPVHDQVRDHLIDLIRSGEYPRGSALPAERELATKLGVSRHSLRQALASLEAVGLIEARHGSGVYLAEEPSDAAVMRVSDVLFAPDRSLLEVLEARLAIEPYIAATAAERRTPEDLAVIRDVVGMHGRDGESAEAVSRDVFDFHQWLVGTTGNPVLRGVMRSLTTGAPGVSRLLTQTEQSGLVQRWDDHHHEILDAVAAQDAERARTLMTTHMQENLTLARDDAREAEVSRTD